MMVKWGVVIAALAGLTTGASAQQMPPPDRVVLVRENDPEMNAAQAKARASLGEFWKHFILPGGNETKFSLKMAISDGRMVAGTTTVEVKDLDAAIAWAKKMPNIGGKGTRHEVEIRPLFG